MVLLSQPSAAWYIACIQSSSLAASSGNKETREFIKTIATFDKDKGAFVVKVGDDVVKVSNLQKGIAESLLSENKTLEKRAEDAQGFMTRIKNLMESLKSLGFAFFAGLDKTMGPMLDRLTGRGEGTLTSFADKFESWGEQLGTWLSKGDDLIVYYQQGYLRAIVSKITSHTSVMFGRFSNS